ncbi:hypothetical protein N7471_011912 [Penicillium samsonianum]|uniref:uncharacterized protein n=1 Tax=Penicillium samsonianum TaxID=1882272 RepID=UPI002548EF9C|nr:uncharacterized protein N7471_011912 [Penicillium samsonianum]KAJ6124595.1 hypothetical protein N7471_011912 [Penicillium samsonianum]
MELKGSLTASHEVDSMDDGVVVLDLNSLTPTSGNRTELKLASDGHTILIPQPKDDASDPLNWSTFKKHAILLCVAFGSFAGDFGMAIGIPAAILQSEEWKVSASVVNEPNNLAVMMIGISSLLWVPLLSSWGRAPVLFWSTVMGLFFTLGCVLAPNFPTYYAMRALQGVTQGTGSSIGLQLIQDMFFFHEHPRKIGLWYGIFLVSPFAGPMLGNFMVAGLGTWRPLFWLVFAFAACLTVMIIACADESFYNRDVADEKQPKRAMNTMARLSRVVGWWQLQHHREYYRPVLPCYLQLFKVALRPIILLVVINYGVLFMWSIGINQSSALLLELPQASGGYGMSARAIGYVYFGPIVSVFLGWFVGHFLNDYAMEQYTKRHQGRFVPEARLWVVYLAALVMIPGIVLVGITLQQHLHWVGILFGWGMFQGGVMIISVVMVAYGMDCCPAASGEVSAFLNLGRAACGFAVGYFQQPWGLKQGYDVSFGLQAVITVVAFLGVVCIQVFGAKLRRFSLGMAL